jgi:hypothetical protein
VKFVLYGACMAGTVGIQVSVHPSPPAHHFSDGHYFCIQVKYHQLDPFRLTIIGRFLQHVRLTDRVFAHERDKR